MIGAALAQRKASEVIRARILQLTAQRAYTLESGGLALATEYSATKDALSWALDLIEAQEREQEWIPFAERMPEPPVDGERRSLLVKLPHDFIVYTNDDQGEWLDDEGDDVSAYGNIVQKAYWRFVVPPEAAGGGL